jgi:hypothetical protein
MVYSLQIFPKIVDATKLSGFLPMLKSKKQTGCQKAAGH